MSIYLIENAVIRGLNHIGSRYFNRLWQWPVTYSVLSQPKNHHHQQEQKYCNLQGLRFNCKELSCEPLKRREHDRVPPSVKHSVEPHYVRPRAECTQLRGRPRCSPCQKAKEYTAQLLCMAGCFTLASPVSPPSSSTMDGCLYLHVQYSPGVFRWQMATLSSYWQNVSQCKETSISKQTTWYK